MYVRLAFAVASHMEPEILIVDEVLAVGDATYQLRCIDRMAAVARSGRTVIFVSHNMDIIPRLCRKAALLDAGQLVDIGPAKQIVSAYLERNTAAADSTDLDGSYRTGDGRARFLRWWLERADGSRAAAHCSGEDLSLCMEIEVALPVKDVAMSVVLRSLSGTRLITSWTREVGVRFDMEPGQQVYRCRFERVAVRPGNRLAIMLWMESSGVIDSIEDAGILDVVDGSRAGRWSMDSAQGLMLHDYTWQRVR